MRWPDHVVVRYLLGSKSISHLVTAPSTNSVLNTPSLERSTSVTRWMSSSHVITMYATPPPLFSSFISSALFRRRVSTLDKGIKGLFIGP